MLLVIASCRKEELLNPVNPASSVSQKDIAAVIAEDGANPDDELLNENNSRSLSSVLCTQ